MLKWRRNIVVAIIIEILDLLKKLSSQETAGMAATARALGVCEIPENALLSLAYDRYILSR